jgi:hypothetical protein
MKKLTLLVLLFLLVAPRHNAIALTEKPTSEQFVVGQLVLFDAFLHSNSSHEDMIVKASKPDRLVRLLYAATGFGFDAPPARNDQLMPRDIFQDGRVVWKFSVHEPYGSEETQACKAIEKKNAPNDRGNVVATPRYIPVPESRAPASFDPMTLPCFIIDKWEKS